MVGRNLKYGFVIYGDINSGNWWLFEDREIDDMCFVFGFCEDS